MTCILMQAPVDDIQYLMHIYKKYLKLTTRTILKQFQTHMLQIYSISQYMTSAIGDHGYINTKRTPEHYISPFNHP